MPVTRFTEITAASAKSFDDAIDTGLKKAVKTIPGVTGIEILSVKAKVQGGKIKEYRVKLKVTFDVKR